MAEMMFLNAKRILVTGASSGIGRATAICCAAYGARVILTGRNAERLDETRKALVGDGHLPILAELTNDAEIARLFDEVCAEGAKLDGVVHCAGISCVMPLKALTRERLHKVMNVNFYSFTELIRLFIRKKCSNDGASIIGISSALTLYPRPYELGYTASKAAMEAAVPVIAAECAQRRIRVNCVAPGNVKTEMSEQNMRELDNAEAVEAMVDHSLFGWQKPEDIAELCAFLLSDKASTITGRVIRADGGYR